MLLKSVISDFLNCKARPMAYQIRWGFSKVFSKSLFRFYKDIKIGNTIRHIEKIRNTK